ncbi:unnamed protein product, partial [marine sediment metagenome]
LLKQGIWAFGPDTLDVEKGALWAVDPAGFHTGYISWESDPNKPANKLNEIMVPATDMPVDPNNLPDTGCAWDEQLQMSLVCITGSDAGTRCIWNSTSKGGVRAINGVLGELVQVLGTGESDKIVPVIELLVDSYEHKRYGKVFVPVLEVKRWASLSETPAQTDAPEQEKEAEPEQEPEAPKAETKVRTRRRRRAA